MRLMKVLFLVSEGSSISTAIKLGFLNFEFSSATPLLIPFSDQRGQRAF